MWLEPINSYFRLLVHRVARYYGLSHHVDYSRRGLICLERTNYTLIPLLQLAELKGEESGQHDEPAPLSRMRPEERRAILSNMTAPKHVLLVSGLNRLSPVQRRKLWEEFNQHSAILRAYPNAPQGLLLCKSVEHARQMKQLPVGLVKLVDWEAQFYQEE